MVSPMVRLSEGVARTWGPERKEEKGYAGLVAAEPHCGLHRRLTSTYAVRSCVRVAQMPPEWGWGGGQIANRALGVPDDPVAGCSGLA